MVRGPPAQHDDDFISIASSDRLSDYDKVVRDYDEIPDILYVTKSWNGRGGWHAHESDKALRAAALATSDNAPGKQPVIEIVTLVDTRNPSRHAPHEGLESCVKVEMRIRSAYLKTALAAVIDYYPDFNYSAEKVVVQAPYQVLIHHAQDLEMYKVNQPSCHDAEYTATTAQHIDILLSFLKTNCAAQLEVASNRRINAISPTTTFDLFWVYLVPGEIMYEKVDGEMNPYVVERVTRTEWKEGMRGAYEVDYWDIAFRSTNLLQRRLHTGYVYPWDGERAIHDLPMVPARFVPGGELEMAKKQKELGKLYWELCKQPSYKDYNGTVFDTLDPLAGKTTQTAGRVVVDCEGGMRYAGCHPEANRRLLKGGGPRAPRSPRAPPPHEPQLSPLPRLRPRCTCTACKKAHVSREANRFAGFDDLDPRKDEPPANDQLYFHILQNTILAFILKERRWGRVKVGSLKDVKPDREAFNYLVLDDEVKQTVRALVGKFANTDGKVSAWPSDFVKNKGEGRIFLLHGAPGVGKTCTAECVAELVNLPLLALTSGDLIPDVEPNLEYFFALGERFGALVLLDEADVYLEARSPGQNVERNGLVSVFLRALEYYRGVLFLTTNRVGTFDSALTSRIHVALHYRRLTHEHRQRIWMHNFERLERDSGGKCYISTSGREYVLHDSAVRAVRWNGREIRNALQTAVALAENEALENSLEKVTLSDKHLRAVVKMSRGFKDYLGKTKRRSTYRGYDERSGTDSSSDSPNSSESDLSGGGRD
ncbi:P-loop containing nucleoside triphosphate hydrolase protein [Diplogelasinospora grovesii]|uniref:P-loop containing nucleoside triphosphate hydrolase protein n=1 Tax=Diplogelasinospora grovesii TaxID=303347 RepID=A0AAN6SA26_9PEZI|nr:P-loop containing nucleoside triphosphate hydrolase protein [Diplogelasinospora grovesii]